jgi:tryptophan halogenase
MSGPIRTVAVVGDGIVAWSAAAALRRRLPWLSVTVVRAPVSAAALADRVACTLPSILGFHDDLRIGDEDAVLRTGALARLGTAFDGWTGEGSQFFHGYGAHGRPFGTASFQQHWVRAARSGATESFHDYSPAAALALAGRFAPAGATSATPLRGYEHGLVLDPARYRAMLRALALHSGAQEAGDFANVTIDARGFVECVRTVGGTRIAADLFVDAAGPAAPLRGPLGGLREHWGAQLPCDRVVIAEAVADDERPAFDRVRAEPNGWSWRASAADTGQTGACFSSHYAAAPGEAADLLQGAWERPWIRNCIAVGDAAVAIEPLEWSNLHLAHSAIDRIVAMLPDRDCAEIELAEYNRQSLAEARRVRDFVLLHYVTARRPEPFWRASAAVALPSSLEHTLTQFRERGRLPTYEEETFTRDSWAAVLFGQGVLPRRVDPLIEDTDPDVSAREMARFRADLTGAIAAAPSHKTFHDHQKRHVAR